MRQFKSKKMRSMEEIFKIIRDYHKLNLSLCLRSILAERGISIALLHQNLTKKNYSMSLESLYRYFNPNLKSNRLPSSNFMRVFVEIIQLTDEEVELLFKFWIHCKLSRKSSKLFFDGE